MSAKVFLIVLLSVAYSKSQENNQICPCDSEAEMKANKDLWDLLKKLSIKVDDDDTKMKELYSVSPGSLYQFDCSHCEKKEREKRKTVSEPTEKAVELPEEIVKDKVEIEDVDREKRTISFRDVRCPRGYARISSHCIPRSQIEYPDDLEYE